MSEYIQHFGVKGMKWGQRRDNPGGVSNRTNREAKKDAQEFTRAKLFYGDGAGNRRKLIKATVEAKSKRDPGYAKAFDHHVNNTDLGKRASQARRERRRKDVAASTAKTARGVKNLLGGQGVSLGAVAVVGLGAAGLAAHRAGVDRMLLNKGKTLVNNIRSNSSYVKSGAKFLKDLGL